MSRDVPFCAALLRFDEETSSCLTRIGGELAEGRTGASRSGGYPHVTLLPTDCANDAIRITALRDACRTRRHVQLSLSSIGIFPDSGVVYLGVTATRCLLDLHREISEALTPAADTPYLNLYREGAWIPHCTLASGLSLSRLGEAVGALAKRVRLPIDAPAVAIDFVRVRPEGFDLVESIALVVEDALDV